MPYVYQKLDDYDISRELLADQYANWTEAQSVALAFHLIQCAEYMDQSLEFDRVAVRCDFTAFESLFDLAGHYGKDFPDEENVLDYFQDFTTVIECDDGTVIIQEF